MQATGGRNFLCLTGATIIIVFGLLAAFIPNLGYVTVYSDFLGRTLPELDLPRIAYPTFELSVHLYTIRFIVIAFSGVLGIFSLIMSKSKKIFLAFSCIILGNIAFWVPQELHSMIPEVTYSDLPWVGSLLVITGISIFFLGFSLNKSSVPRFTLLSIPLLFGTYMTYVLVITSGNLFWLGTLSPHFSWQYIMTNLLFLIFVVGQLLMIWGAYKAVKSGLKKNREQKESWLEEKKWKQLLLAVFLIMVVVFAVFAAFIGFNINKM